MTDCDFICEDGRDCPGRADLRLVVEAAVGRGPWRPFFACSPEHLADMRRDLRFLGFRVRGSSRGSL